MNWSEILVKLLKVFAKDMRDKKIAEKRPERERAARAETKEDLKRENKAVRDFNDLAKSWEDE